MIVEDVTSTLGPKMVNDFYDKLKQCFVDKSVKMTGKNVADQPISINLNMATVIEEMSRNQLSLLPINANPVMVKKAIAGDLPIPSPPAVSEATDILKSESNCPSTSQSDIVKGTPRNGSSVRLISSFPTIPLLKTPSDVETPPPKQSVLQNNPASNVALTTQTNNINDESFLQNLQGYFTIVNAMQAIAPLPLSSPNTDNNVLLSNFLNLFNNTANVPENSQPEPVVADAEVSPNRLPGSRRGRRIPCEFCSERFSSREEARIHSETVHIELFQYTCMEENCKKRYKARQGLATHCSKTGHLMPPPNLPSYYSSNR